MAPTCADKGVGFVDAPVCYGLQGAIHGNLISLCGGSDADIAKVTPVLIGLQPVSVEHLGPHGTGQLGKTCNNMMHWAACVANYEVLALAKSCGIDAQAMRETLLKCPARNTTLERWDTTKFTWHEKDMDVALDLSQQAGSCPAAVRGGRPTGQTAGPGSGARIAASRIRPTTSACRSRYGRCPKWFRNRCGTLVLSVAGH